MSDRTARRQASRQAKRDAANDKLSGRTITDKRVSKDGKETVYVEVPMLARAR